MGRSTIERQINNILYSKQGFGESRHEAKQQLREEKGTEYRFGMTDDKIHSYDTFDTYQKACQRFGKWLQEEKDINKKADINKCKEFAKEYIQYRLDVDKVSVWTAKMERSALSKLYGEKIEIDMPKRDTKDIVRSRGEKEQDKHFSEERHIDLVTFAKATGCRRCDLEKLTPAKFYTDRNDVMWVKIEKSKGGRDRVAPILPKYREFVGEYLAGKDKDTKLFHKISHSADIHSYRGDYARELYKAVEQDKDFKDKILARYPTRHEYKIIKDRETGESRTYEIQSNTYNTRGENKQTFDRDEAYICTCALGHERLEVTVTHYLKQ